MIVGMRVIKTALAMAIGVLISSLFHLEYPFFTVIAAIIAMQNTLDDSFKKGLGRIYGTSLGGIAGIIYLQFFMANNVFWNATIIGLLAVLIMYIQLKLKWSQSIQISLIVFLSICITTREESVSYYALVRILDTIVGIGIAFAVNFLISPPNYAKQFVDEAEQLFLEEKQGFLHKVNDEQEIDVELLEKHMTHIKELYKIYLADSRWRSSKNLFQEGTKEISWDEVIKDLDDVYRHICIMEELQLYGKLDEENHIRVSRMNQSEINNAYEECLYTEYQGREQAEVEAKLELEYQEYHNVYGEYLEEETKAIYNYHIYKILDGLERIETQLDEEEEL